jgi:hypothetical protein
LHVSKSPSGTVFADLHFWRRIGSHEKLDPSTKIAQRFVNVIMLLDCWIINMSSMKVTVFRVLPDDQVREWNKFLNESPHTHPEQDIRFAHVLRAEGNDVVFVMGWVDHVLRAVALFSLSPHPFLKGYYREAMTFSGPVCDNPKDLIALVEGLLAHDTITGIGRVRVTPYWLEDDATIMQAALSQAGWSVFEDDKVRQTGLVDLSGTEADILGRFSKSARAEVRKAERQGLTVEIIREKVDALEFLASLDRHRAERGLGLVPEPVLLAALENVYRTEDLGIILALRQRDIFIAGLALYRGKRITHAALYTNDAAKLRTLQNLRVSPFLWLQAMKWAKSLGCQSLDVEGYNEITDTNNKLYRVYKYKAELSPKLVTRVAGHQKTVNLWINLSGNARDIMKVRAKSLRKVFRENLHRLKSNKTT